MAFPCREPKSLEFLAKNGMALLGNAVNNTITKIGMTKKVHIKSYGCQMNVYDSERMADILADIGFVMTPEPENADLVILNTCHIREKAAEKVYSDIGRLRKLRAKGTIIAVAGCVAQAEGEEIIYRAPAVELVFGPQTYHRLPQLLADVDKARTNSARARIIDTDFPIEEKFDHLPNRLQDGASSAFLTIQEGCDKFCTFCVVPYTRGGEFSRSVVEIETEAKALIAAGAKEITLLGQNVNAYHGLDEAGIEIRLGGLIRRLAEIPGLLRIRYTTSHPCDMDEDLITVHKDMPVCMPYLHLPVQSGSDVVLKAMNRRHSAGQYLSLVDRIRKARPDIALSSDFIVGFPGETDTDFRATMRLVEQVEYAQAYSFKYSIRPGTPAARDENQVPENVKAERLAELQALLNAQQKKFNEATIGKTLEVLFEREGKHPGQVVGRSPYMQAVHVSLGERMKDDYVKHGKRNLTNNVKTYKGKIVPVEIIDAGPNSLEGKLITAPQTRSAA